MAKRLKLADAEGSGINKEENKLQSLLTVPEAKKMVDLDEEMAKLVHRKDLTMEEKVRMYEEKIFQFRKAKDAVLNMGGVLMTDQQQENMEREKVVKQVTDAVRAILEQLPETEIRQQHPQVQEMTQDMKQENDEATPPKQPRKVIKPKRIRLQTTPAPPSPPATLDRVKEVLEKSGFVQEPNHVRVPTQDGTVRRYKKSTYETALKYFFDTKESNHSPKRPPIRVKNILSSIHHTLNSTSDFQELLNKYPAFQQYHADVPFSLWDEDIDE